MVFAIGLKILKSREDAEDIVQDIFAHKIPELMKTRPELGTEELGRLLAAIARNLCIDRYRRRRRFPQTELDPESAVAGSGSATEIGKAEELAGLLEELEPRYREVLTLKYLM